MIGSESPPAPSTSTTAGAPAGDTFARLHISPLDSDLLKVVVPAAVLPKARNVSFHTIETFPERRYGFVDLPSADAEKLRKKFHGSTLRGSKMRVEKAKPEKRHEPSVDEEETGKKRKKKSSEDKEERKKRKRDYNAVEGVMLPEDRKVKRGWTITSEEAKHEKRKSKSKDKTEKKGRKVKSKYTDKEECLMKTVLPANAPTAAEVVAKNSKKKKKGKAKREVVVHEFENTSKFPSFLRASSDAAPAKPVSTGQTWPGVSNATTGEVAKPVVVEKPVEKPAEKPEEDAQSTSSEESDSDSDSDSDGAQPTEASEAKPDADDSDEDDSESESASATSEKNVEGKDAKMLDSDDSESESASTTSQKNGEKGDVTMSSPVSARPRSSSSARNLSIQIPPSTPAAASKEVHPLEALYKKSKDADNVQSTPAAAEPFSFFGGGADSEEDDEEEDLPARSSQPPMTPFTKQDFDQRNIRSAAPTPDTAHPSRTRMFWAPNGGDDLQEEDEEEQPEPSPRRPVQNEEAGAEAGDKEDKEVSDFHSWFYENRRELNRSWMDRRRTAKKERRQRDNRAKGGRA